ncbi:hypothetical protein C8046_10645 [Serinibacter arcticus]|uniref:Mini-circle protein n=1 Tax=Serinibacter arcticus TaxID=1655435 RepID=A0A2U1ZVL7_9MICO|nr:DUF664 domain-containing protein [Serinibacter arcticus]PWD51037.1 hypothetical protein C8046_10645 [Serinibacter arcticus]
MSTIDPLQTLLDDERTQLDARLDAHRHGLRASLDGLTEEEVHRRLVQSDTTLIGLLAHVTYVEQIWSQEAVLGRPRAELGLPPSPADAFHLPHGRTIDAALAAHAAAVEQSRHTLALRGLGDVVTGHAFGPMTVRWVLLHLLSELAQHHGHAEILREQVLALRD